MGEAILSNYLLHFPFNFDKTKIYDTLSILGTRIHSKIDFWYLYIYISAHTYVYTSYFFNIYAMI